MMERGLSGSQWAKESIFFANAGYGLALKQDVIGIINVQLFFIRVEKQVQSKA